MLALAPTTGVGGLFRAANAPAPVPTPQQPQAPAEPQETFGQGVWRETKEMSLTVGNITGTSIGGAIGLASLTLGLYAGVAGGAIFLGALGAGFGPVLASVSSHGLLSFIGTSFHTMGVAAKTGVVLGGLAVGGGSFFVGRAIGETVGT